MRALLVGAVESSRVALEAIARAPGWTLAGIATLEPRLAGRHSDFVDLGAVAEAHGAPVVHVASINDPEAMNRMTALAPDHVFVIGWSQICGARFREIARDRIVGYHPAALPRMRGRAAIPWTILLDEPITAGTLFWIDEGTDTGRILDQQYFHVSPAETAASLYAKHMAALATMLDRTLATLARGEAPRRDQDESCATWCARRTDRDGAIDWSEPAASIHRLVRAVGDPYPGASSATSEGPLRILAADLASGGDRHAARPGQVVTIGDGGFGVVCGDGALLRITRWRGASDKPPRLHSVLGGAG